MLITLAAAAALLNPIPAISDDSDIETTVILTTAPELCDVVHDQVRDGDSAADIMAEAIDLMDVNDFPEDPSNALLLAGIVYGCAIAFGG